MKANLADQNKQQLQEINMCEHRGKTHCAWAQNLTSGQLFISDLVYKPIA